MGLPRSSPVIHTTRTDLPFSPISPCEERLLNRPEKTPRVLTLQVWSVACEAEQSSDGVKAP